MAAPKQEGDHAELPKKTKKIITSAGYTVIKTAIEKQMEEDREIPYLWILAQKEV
jgi:hypothetical protein